MVMALAATPGALPMFVAALAVVDAEHRVQLGLALGESTVVLHHEAGCAARSPQHRHCPLSRALVFFSESTGGNPDHVLHFAGGAKYLRDQPLVLTQPALLVAVLVTTPIFVLAHKAPRRILLPDITAPH